FDPSTERTKPTSWSTPAPRTRWAPARELRRIGVESVGTKVYELADGTRQEYPFGLVEIAFMGEITAGRVIFGPDDVEPLLGVTALESVGITVDPATQTLRRLPAIPLKQGGVGATAIWTLAAKGTGSLI